MCYHQITAYFCIGGLFIVTYFITVKPLPFPSYGKCSVYKWENDICAGVFRPGIDIVYAKSVLGNQSAIADLLNGRKKEVEAIISDHDEECVKQVFRVLCHFYLPPCGNTTHPAPPSSICQEECQMVQENCQKTWNSVLLAFKSIDPVIYCSDTSTLLFPVPHCCIRTDQGLTQTQTHTKQHTLM